MVTLVVGVRRCTLTYITHVCYAWRVYVAHYSAPAPYLSAVWTFRAFASDDFDSHLPIYGAGGGYLGTRSEPNDANGEVFTLHPHSINCHHICVGFSI